MATAAVVAGAAGVVPATAAGTPLASSPAKHSRAPQQRPALVSPAALPAEVGAAVTRGPGAEPIGLAASSVTVAGGGDARWEHGTDPAAGSPWVGVVRARGPPS
jgi:hypothetical protein